MFTWYVIVAGVLAFLVLGAGLAKVNGVPQVKQLLEHVGAWSMARPLGVLLILGAAGLVVGMFVAPIGAVAAGALALYFLGAVVAHLRAGDGLSAVANPFVPLVLAAVALWLRLATA